MVNHSLWDSNIYSLKSAHRSRIYNINNSAFVKNFL